MNHAIGFVYLAWGGYFSPTEKNYDPTWGFLLTLDGEHF